MPKVNYFSAPPNYLAVLFSRYRKGQKITSNDIADKLGCSPENVRCQMNKDVEKWRIEDLVKYCRILNIPIMEAFTEIERSLK